jgi:RNA-directed DNA polymerase
MKKEGFNKTSPKLNKQQLGEAWQSIDWKKCQRHVDRLQRSIASAMERGKKKMVRQLQRILYKSEAYNLICTRKVTQDNQGKKTAGVDGVKELNPAQRMELALGMNDGILRKSNPVRQKEIPKKNGKVRTLGIPTLKDRVYQAKLKGIIEPCYEVIAEPNSYGFRPMRSTKDAIEQIFLNIRFKKEAWVLEGDLKGFFDNIKTDAITDSQVIKGDAEITATIKRLVKSGAITVNQEYIETDMGTPQGGVISPLLANIAFNGLETMINEWAWENRKRTGQRRKNNKVIHTVVYADDFVVIAKERWIIEELKEVISKWCMDKMGVELSREKTRITNVKDGFDFLGCNIRQYEINSTKSKTLIKPSKDSIKSVKAKIHQICKKCTGKSQDVLIGRLNQVLTGWGNYHKGNVAKEIFAAIDHYVFERTWKWASMRHSNKGKEWIKGKYWHSQGRRNWVFKTESNTLKWLRDIKIKRHIKIKSEHHVFDSDKEYWTRRRLMNKAGKTMKEWIMEKQKFKCNHCKELFKYDSVTEIDHIVPKACGGTNEAKNLQVLHRHCHDIKTRTDGSLDQRLHVKGKGRKPHKHCR